MQQYIEVAYKDPETGEVFLQVRGGFYPFSVLAGDNIVDRLQEQYTERKFISLFTRANLTSSALARLKVIYRKEDEVIMKNYIKSVRTHVPTGDTLFEVMGRFYPFKYFASEGVEYFESKYTVWTFMDTFESISRLDENEEYRITYIADEEVIK